MYRLPIFSRPYCRSRNISFLWGMIQREIRLFSSQTKRFFFLFPFTPFERSNLDEENAYMHVWGLSHGLYTESGQENVATFTKLLLLVPFRWLPLTSATFRNKSRDVFVENCVANN